MTMLYKPDGTPLRPRNDLDDWWDRHILPIAERWAREYPHLLPENTSTLDVMTQADTEDPPEEQKGDGVPD